MVRIKVGSEERDLNQVDEQWLCRQVNGRRGDKQPDCVQVIIKEPKLDMILTTPACSGLGGGGRAPNPQEKQVFDLWDKHHLNETGFNCGQVTAFLKQLQKLV